MITDETILRIKGMTTKELEENLALERFNKEKAAVARLELAKRSKEATMKTSEENLEPIKSQTKASWWLVWLTGVLVVCAVLTLIGYYIWRK